MEKEITLVLATEEDAKLIHEMKYKAFLPLYEKYHDDGTNPAMEKIEKVFSRNFKIRVLATPQYKKCLTNIHRQKFGAWIPLSR